MKGLWVGMCWIGLVALSGGASPSVLQKKWGASDTLLKRIPNLLEKLESKNWHDRKDAVHALRDQLSDDGRFEEGWEVLRRLLEDPSPWVRRLAVDTLGAYTRPEVTDLLKRLYRQDQDYLTRMIALRKLCQSREAALAPLLVGIMDGNDRVEFRVEAAWHAAAIGGEETFPAYDRLLQSADPRLRAAALQGLDRMVTGHSRFKPAVLKRLQDQDAEVRLTAVRWWGVYPDPDPDDVKALRPLLQDAVPSVAEAARAALAKLSASAPPVQEPAGRYRATTTLISMGMTLGTVEEVRLFRGEGYRLDESSTTHKPEGPEVSRSVFYHVPPDDFVYDPVTQRLSEASPMVKAVAQHPWQSLTKPFGDVAQQEPPVKLSLEKVEGVMCEVWGYGMTGPTGVKGRVVEWRDPVRGWVFRHQVTLDGTDIVKQVRQYDIQLDAVPAPEEVLPPPEASILFRKSKPKEPGER